MLLPKNRAGKRNTCRLGGFESMAKILVIDHEPALRRSLCHLFSSNGFQVQAVAQGVEAAKLMRHDVPDVILVDQNIPLGGIKTAQIIRLNDRYQGIPIMLGLKPASPEQTRSVIKTALQTGISWVIARPYKSDLLLAKTKEHMHANGAEKKKISPEMRSLAIRKKIRELTDLPTLSPTQQRIIAIMSCDDADVNMNALIEAIQADQALAMRTLRIARSAGYGFRGNLIPSAVTFLGVQKVRQIVQSATILEIFGNSESSASGGLDPIKFWQHSIACGMVMQKISRDNFKSKHFMAGLLHDVGKLVLDLQFAPYSKVIGEIARREMRARHLVEQELIGISHAEIGQEIAVLWDLPNELAEGIAFHHAPSAAQRHKLLTALVYIADVIARNLGIGHSGNFVPAEIEDAFAKKIKLPVSMEQVLSEREEFVKQIDGIIAA